jgi:LytS/YehU family sensor histidine kinase
VKLSIDWFYFNKNENLELKNRNQQIQTQLSSLRSQINPHFLFNSLNVIYALALENKEETKDAIVQLSNILRYIIYDSNTRQIPLKDELFLLNNYIEFQKFRNKESDTIKFNIAMDNDAFLIYPMLLLPLIENSFKYGDKGSLERDFISIDFIQKDNEFLFQIENSYLENDSSVPNEYSGVGIENIKKNLEIVYPNAHEFKISKTKNLFSVSLKLFNYENKLHNSR